LIIGIIIASSLTFFVMRSCRQLIDVGADTSATEHDYAIEWDDQQVQFFIDGQSVRTQALERPLKPLQLSSSVWTTTNGWEGLKAWVSGLRSHAWVEKGCKRSIM